MRRTIISGPVSPLRMALIILLRFVEENTSVMWRHSV